MSEVSDRRSRDFLKVSGQFQLGALVTESSHPLTAGLSDAASRDPVEALGLLFAADGDVVSKYRECAASGRLEAIHSELVRALRNGGRVFFTGCGSTGRLSIQLVSIWRDFWQSPRARNSIGLAAAQAWEQRALSVMAGGDFALIKSVEGFEDLDAFGRRQIGDLGVSDRDVVFAITEGGETSFVIGTAWAGVNAGARVYFVYNNPDEALCRLVHRSREVIVDPRIEKINLTTGPMAITGSTRMQATTIQLCVLLTVLEMAARELLSNSPERGVPGAPTLRGAADPASAPGEFLAALGEMHGTLKSPRVLSGLAGLVALEEATYRAAGKNNYYADRFAIDVLTDTTERTPTFCTPPFRKFDDAAAADSWSFLFLAEPETAGAWERLLKRKPSCIEWSESDVRDLAGPERAAAIWAAVRSIGSAELMRFKIGMDGLPYRQLEHGDSAVAVLGPGDTGLLTAEAGFCRRQLEAAQSAGARLGLICLGNEAALAEMAEAFAGIAPKAGAADAVQREAGETHRSPLAPPGTIAAPAAASPAAVRIPVPSSGLLLDGVTRVGLKMALNAMSTCVMVRLGRVMGNCMIWVVPSNLKLIDRATRYIQKLAGLPYDQSNRLLFEALEYVEPRMKSDRAYPPPVGLAVLRARHHLTHEEAEGRIQSDAALQAGSAAS